MIFWLIRFVASAARELCAASKRPVPGNRNFRGLLLGDRVAAAGSLPRSQMVWLTSSRHPLRSGVTVVQPARGTEALVGPGYPRQSTPEVVGRPA
jgi:hypothetical protein